MNRALSVRCSSLLAVSSFAIAIAAGTTASADTFDLALQRLVLPPQNGGYADPGSQANIDAGALIAYRQVVSELAAALAPGILTTADTVGYSGFQFTADYSLTTISTDQAKCQVGVDPSLHKGDCPWNFAVEGGKNGAKLPGMLNTLTVMARKGIWMPLPSFEIGAGASKLLQSNLFTVQVYAKFALHEGFHKWPIPSLAVRGSATRVMGESQIDLTMAQLDVSISKSIGIAGTVTLVPYAGAAWLYAIPRGQVLDLTPDHDAFRDGPSSVDLNNNAVFPSSANADITRWRFFGGMRLNYNILVLTADFIATMCGDFNGGCAGDRHPTGKIADNAATQYTFSASAGFLF